MSSVPDRWTQAGARPAVDAGDAPGAAGEEGGGWSKDLRRSLPFIALAVAAFCCASAAVARIVAATPNPPTAAVAPR